MEDSIITSRQAAQILGVSIRTAQNWIEDETIESWKTPGGHRRVRRSAVLQFRDRLSRQSTAALTTALVLAGRGADVALRDTLQSANAVQTSWSMDCIGTMLEAGATPPDFLIVEIVVGDWDRVNMVRHALTSEVLSSTRFIIVTPASENELHFAFGRFQHIIVLAHDQVRLDLLAILASAELWFGPRLIANTALNYPTHSQENARLAAVRGLGLSHELIDPEKFREITEVSSRIMDAPISIITILDEGKQYFLGSTGMLERETPRAWAFCNYTILQEEVFVVEDALKDSRFMMNPLVCDFPNVRFYAGVSIRSPEGYPYGALCVINNKPGHFNAMQKHTLKVLADLTSDKINLVATIPHSKKNLKDNGFSAAK